MTLNNSKVCSESRKELFNKILSISSNNLIKESGIKKGMHVLDLGCGEGNITLFLCELVGRNGHVTAIDKDQDKLTQLSKQAKLKGIDNLTLLAADVTNELGNISNVDIIYSRFFLMHLLEPLNILNIISAKINNNCKLILEEPILSATSTYPDTDFWHEAINAYQKLCCINNISPDYGKQLLVDLSLSGFEIKLANHVQPIINLELAREYLKFALNAHKDEYIESGVLEQDNYQSLLDKINNPKFDEIKYCGFHGVMQIICTKALNNGHGDRSGY